MSQRKPQKIGKDKKKKKNEMMISFVASPYKTCTTLSLSLSLVEENQNVSSLHHNLFTLHQNP